MKAISEYLSTKVNRVKESFPDEAETDKHKPIIEWLKHEGFEFVDTTKQISFSDIFDELNAHEKKVYTLGSFEKYNKMTHWIAFKRNGKISTSNLLFYVRTADGVERYIALDKPINTFASATEVYNTYDEFKAAVDA